MKIQFKPCENNPVDADSTTGQDSRTIAEEIRDVLSDVRYILLVNKFYKMDIVRGYIEDLEDKLIDIEKKLP
jgi:hypothetical protein